MIQIFQGRSVWSIAHVTMLPGVNRTSREMYHMFPGLNVYSTFTFRSCKTYHDDGLLRSIRSTTVDDLDDLDRDC